MPGDGAGGRHATPGRTARGLNPAAVVPVVCALAAVTAGAGLTPPGNAPPLPPGTPTGAPVPAPENDSPPAAPTLPGPAAPTLPGPAVAGAARAPAVPFGGHRRSYAPGALRPTGTRADVDARVVALYRQWRAAFVRTHCVGAHVISPDAEVPVVGEAQGYGLLVAAYLAGADPGARELFDAILGYVLAHPSSRDGDLLAAEQDAYCRDVNGGDSATDADLDIAYALLLAHRQWGSRGRHDYRVLALRRIAAIARSEVDPVTHLLRLGDWATGSGELARTSRTSDWMLDHLRAFRRATGDPYWDMVRRAHQRALSNLLAGPGAGTGLVPDFVVDTHAAPRPAAGRVLESEHDGQYSWNACRVPLRVGVDAVTSGDARSVAAARAVTRWVRRATGGDPAAVSSGYALDGTPLAAGAHPAFVAPLAVAALSDPTAQPWLDALWRHLVATPVSSHGYYAASVQLLSMIVVSGNYWVP
ncbi:glycosyl hydrolase family 8 [Luedemannella helvata]|uniref:Glucanase n=1 Tax=Luedemannella helvata TaxID=349315 RepID=A0ABP4X2G8_9ACTN